jgi:hypothetical protein
MGQRARLPQYLVPGLVVGVLDDAPLFWSRKRMKKALLLASLLTTAPAISHAALVYNEGVDGDMGFSAPVLGSAYGRVIGSNASPFQDNFIIELLADEILNSITLFAASGANSTFSVFAGTSTSGSPVTTSYSVISPSHVGQELLTLFDAGPISTPGQYLVNIWHNNTGNMDYTFDLDFTVPAGETPVPASLWLLGFGLGALALRRRRA